MDTTIASLEVLSLDVQALARTLSAPQAHLAADDLRAAVSDLLDAAGPGLDADVDEALAVEARTVLGALGE